jgi:hypothetical protein
MECLIPLSSKTMILHVFIGVCHKLREEYRLRVLENRMLRYLFVHKRKEGTVGLSKLDNEKLHYLHSSPNIWVYQITDDEMKRTRGTHMREDTRANSEKT